MKEKGILSVDQEPPTGIDMALLIMKNYIVYPIEKNDAVVPVNYCMIPKVAPKSIQAPLKYLLSFVC
jgi:hypothetical protein